ncbi:MAG: DNA-primase RepB domain-containing protein, partial [Thermodesulfobacteriota bacterium]|nr:DNA-primase RepB domain-containing protein [Thermodesulfobacteriota bacterium]
LTRQVSIREDQYPVDGEIDVTVPYMSIKIIMGLEKLNEMGAGVFVTINETDGRGRKTANITKVRAVFADFDGTPLPETFPVAPTMIIESSPGKYHVYFKVVDFPLESFKIIQEAIAKKLKSDPKIKDLPRVMRMPGFYHNKKEPFMTRVLESNSTEYTYGEIVAAFPPIPVKQWSAPRYQTPKEYTGEFKGRYGASEGDRNNHLTRRIGGMLNRGLPWSEIEQETYKEAMACCPQVSELEVKGVLKSMRRYI